MEKEGQFSKGLVY